MLIKNRKGTFGDETATRMPQSANVEPAVRFTNLSDLDHDGEVDIVGKAPPLCLWRGLAMDSINAGSKGQMGLVMMAMTRFCLTLRPGNTKEP